MKAVNSIKNNRLITLTVLGCMALVIYNVEFLFIFKSFFGWFETFFHEMSHGLASIFTGGRISHIELNWNGSGLCYSGGGNKFLTTFSGYFGASIWGAMIFLMVTLPSKKTSNLLLGILSLLTLGTLFIGGSLSTFVILTLIIVTIFIIWVYREKLWATITAQFIGVYIMVNSMFSPTYLFSYTNSGDHVSMEKHSGISSTFWIYLWVILCGVIFLSTMYITHKKDKNK